VVADHPDLAADKAALAAILDGAGKHEEAERLLREALALFERLFGEAHYEVAVNLNNLAAIHHRRGDEPQARELYERALAIKQKLLGAAHPDLAPTLANLAALHASAGRTAEARACYSRAIAVLDPIVEPDHPTLIACREDRVSLLSRTAGQADPASPERPPAPRGPSVSGPARSFAARLRWSRTPLPAVGGERARPYSRRPRRVPSRRRV
jgi:tetratricopeptide (TPR) repeat protein